MKEVDKLIKKIHNLEDLIDKHCKNVVNKVFIKYRKTQDDYEEEEFLFDIKCFIQAGDGLVFTDHQGYNVPVRSIQIIIEDKGYFTYEDFKNARI